MRILLSGADLFPDRAVGPRPLGAIERAVGAGDPRRGARVARLERGAADAGRDVQRALGTERSLLYSLADALGDRLGAGAVAAGEQHAELLAAIAPRHVVPAQRLAQDRGHLAQ